MKHSSPIGKGPTHSVHTAGDRSDTVDSDPEGGVFGGTTIGPHPSASAQSTEGVLRFCGGIGSTGIGPQSSPSGHGNTILVERELTGTIGAGRGLAKTARRLQVSSLSTCSMVVYLVVHLTVCSQAGHEKRNE